MAELHNTLMGKKLIEYTLPEIAKQLTRIADLLEVEATKNKQDAELVKAANAYLENSKRYNNEYRTTS
jgi:hypothetical protein